MSQTTIQINKEHVKIISAIILVAIFGFVLLSIVGRFFITEVVQEVEIKDASTKIFGTTIGEEAPHWELVNLDGKMFKTAEFLGRPVVLTFWSTWNQYSADQIRVLDNYLSVNQDSLAVIVTINSQEDRSAVSQFIKRGEYDVPVLLDESGAVSEEYRIKALPTTYFLDSDGIIVDVFVGALSEKMLVEKTESIIR